MGSLLVISKRTHLAPREGVESSRRDVVDLGVLFRLVYGRVPGYGDHHVDWQVYGDEVCDHLAVSLDGVQQTLAHLRANK